MKTEDGIKWNCQDSQSKCYDHTQNPTVDPTNNPSTDPTTISPSADPTGNPTMGPTRTSKDEASNGADNSHGMDSWIIPSTVIGSVLIIVICVGILMKKYCITHGIMNQNREGEHSFYDSVEINDAEYTTVLNK